MKLIIPKMAITIVDDKLVNIVLYIPVAEPTYGCSPSDIKTGLKMYPVPEPEMVPIIDPKKAIKVSLTELLGVHSKSPSTN